MTTDIENHIRQNHQWQKLPANIKQVRLLKQDHFPGGDGLRKVVSE